MHITRQTSHTSHVTYHTPHVKCGTWPGPFIRESLANLGDCKTNQNQARRSPRHARRGLDVQPSAAGVRAHPTWGTVSTGLTGVEPSAAAVCGAGRLEAPDACCLTLRGVCLGVPVSDVSQLAVPSRTLARDDARTEVDRLGLLGTVSRRGVPVTKPSHETQDLGALDDKK